MTFEELPESSYFVVIKPESSQLLVKDSSGNVRDPDKYELRDPIPKEAQVQLVHLRGLASKALKR